MGHLSFVTCILLTGLWGLTQILAKHYFWVWVRSRCFWMTSALELLDSVKQMASLCPHVDEYHPIRWIQWRGWERNCPFCLTAELEHPFLLPSDWDPECRRPWFSGLQTQTKLCHQLLWVSNLQKVDCATSQPPKWRELIFHNLSINLSLSLSQYIDIVISVNTSTDILYTYL